MTVKDLKNALLQEAVQGKLVPQIASEGNARDLLEEIRNEKLSHGLDFANAKSGKRKSKKETALAGSNPCDITEEEIPFDIPESWCWCRLGEIVSILGDGIHGTPNYDISGNYYFVNGNNLNNGKIEIKPDTKKVNQSEYEKYKKELNNNTVFVSINGTLGNIAFYENEKIILGKSACYFNLIKNEMKIYIYWLIKTKYFLDYANEEATGTTIKNVSLAAMRNFPIPLPPLAEQKRIVIAIEKFMPLIEEYGKKETQLKAINEKIGALTKKAILQEAVQGKLVPQIAAEGNARDLLGKIRKERLSHGFANSYGICGEKCKKSKSSDLRSKSQIRVTKKELPEITEDEIPFDIPESWCWCRLGEIVPFGVCQNAEPQEINDEDWILDLEDIEKDSGKILSFKTKKEVDSKSTKHIFKKGFVLYSKLRPYLNKCVIAPKDGFCTSEILPLDFGDMIYNKYAQLYLMSPFFVDYTNSLSFGVKMPRLGTEDGKKALFPLPPLAEQKRIVAAIEKMLPLCEKLGV